LRAARGRNPQRHWRGLRHALLERMPCRDGRIRATVASATLSNGIAGTLA
jgi:hypothetical protein